MSCVLGCGDLVYRWFFFFFQAEDGIRDAQESRGLGDVYKRQLSHRVVLAPLTRNRAAEPSLCPDSEHVSYYSQRASAGGLLITEAVAISPEALAYPGIPGIWTEQQTVAWTEVVRAVHAKGCKIFMQLWHTGRVAQPCFGEHPLARASAGMALPSVSASSTCMCHPRTGKPVAVLTYDGMRQAEHARALTTEEICGRLRDDYVRAAQNAMLAGFDGVELHAAHGYLVDQFLNDGTNLRADRYGGSVPNRCRILFELVEALVRAAGGADRVAVRLSPTTIDPQTGRQNQSYYGATTSDPDLVYEHAVTGLNRFGLAYLLLSEPRWSGKMDHDVKSDRGFAQPLTNHKYRALYHGTLMAAGGFTPLSAAAAIKDGHYDLIGFGRWFLSNPDLPEKIKRGSPLNVYDRSTFYSRGAEGYTDYPSQDGSVGELHKYTLIEQNQIGVSLPKHVKAKL
eukprot:TRINITY_DN30072_c0_g1_i2.p1 TRINITY_DN30072_c0_g1~~TRINITY_DN30072_c0_g1_i2.p1  ORF type:complete len:453 (+),score=89.99 TRINITY_DN30072_c0_g1_i2:84-1442(+)